MSKTLSRRVRSSLLLIAFFAAVIFTLRLLFPFYLAFFTVSLAALVAKRLKRYTRLSPKSLRLILLGVGVFLFCTLAVTAIRAILRESEGFLTSLYDTTVTVARAILNFIERVKHRLHLGEAVTEEGLSTAISELFRQATSALSTRLAALAAAFVKKTPRFLIAAVTSLLSTVYIALDYERVLDVIGRLIPRLIKPTLVKLKNATVSIVLHTLKAYGILFLITFGIVTVAFFLLGIDYPIWWALLAAGLDALPAIGIGLVLIPWAIGLFATERTAAGVLMLALYLGVTLLRQAIEPRILGRELNVPSLVFLIALYLGFTLFGGWGLLLSPILAVSLTRLFRKDTQTVPEKDVKQ